LVVDQEFNQVFELKENMIFNYGRFALPLYFKALEGDLVISKLDSHVPFTLLEVELFKTES